MLVSLASPSSPWYQSTVTHPEHWDNIPQTRARTYLRVRAPTLPSFPLLASPLVNGNPGFICYHDSGQDGFLPGYGMQSWQPRSDGPMKGVHYAPTGEAVSDEAASQIQRAVDLGRTVCSDAQEGVEESVIQGPCDDSVIACMVPEICKVDDTRPARSPDVLVGVFFDGLD